MSSSVLSKYFDRVCKKDFVHCCTVMLDQTLWHEIVAV